MPLPSNHPYKKFPPVVDYEEVLWTPQQIATALWLDAADLSTFTLDSGAVSQWRDKSGNNKHASASGSIRPTYSATGFNTKPTVVFDGTDDKLDLVYIAQQVGQRVFAVVDTTNLQGTDSRVLLNRTIPSSPYAPAIYLSNVDSAVRRPAVYWGTTWHTTCTTALQRKYILGIELLSSIVKIFIDGTYIIGNANTQTVVTNWIEISTAPNYNQQSAFNLSELIILPPASTDNDAVNVYGYLAHKWGMASLLHTTHQFKVKPPVIEKPLNYFTAMNLESRQTDCGISPLVQR